MGEDGARETFGRLDNRRWTGADALVLLGLAGLVAIAFWEVIAQGRVFFFRDFSLFFYPKRHFVTEAIRHFDIPFWNQYGGCGEPVLGSYQVAVFYPLALIYYLLPMPHSFMWFVVAHFFLTGAGMYYLMRTFGARRPAAGVAAVAWAFSPVFVAVVDNVSFQSSLCWLPWCLAFTRRLCVGGAFRAFVGLVITFALAVLAGGPEPVIFVAGIVVAYAVVFAVTDGLARGWPRAWRPPVLAVAALFAATVLSGVEVVPFLYALYYSGRPTIPLEKAVLWAAAPSDALLWFLPRFLLFADRGGIYWRSQYWLKTVYMGVAVPFLAVWTVTFIRRGTTGRVKAAWIVVLALFGILMTLPLGRYMFETAHSIEARQAVRGGAAVEEAETAPVEETGTAAAEGAATPVPFGWRIIAALAGLLPGALAGYFIASTRRRNLFFAFLALFAMLLAIGKASFLWRLLWVYLPGFSLIRFPVKWFFPAAFAMAVLAGFGVDDALVCARRGRDRRLMVLFAAILAAALLFGAGWAAMAGWRAAAFTAITPPQVVMGGADAIETAWERFFAAQWSFGRSASCLLAVAAALAGAAFLTRKRIPRPYGGIALALVLFADIAIFGAHLNPVAGPETYIEPPSHLSLLPHGPTAKRLHATVPLVKYLRESRLARIQDLIGLDNYISLVKGVRFSSPGELLRWLARTSAPPFGNLSQLDEWLKTTNSPQFVTAIEQESLKEAFHPNLNVLYQVPSTDSFEPVLARGHFKLLELMWSGELSPRRERYLPRLWGATHVVDHIPRPPGFIYLPIRPPGERALLAEHFIAVESDDEAYDKLLNTDIDVLSRVLLLSEDAERARQFLGAGALGAPAEEAVRPGTARVVADSGDAMTVEVEAERRALLFVADNYFPRFRARVDGEPAPIWKANYAYRAVPVEAGRHEVEFVYRPTEFYAGVLLTLAGAAALFALARRWPRANRTADRLLD